MENPTLGCGPHNVRKSEICRLCMKSHEYYLNIFVINEEFTTSIGKTIEDLLVLKVAKGDNLPEMVCCLCVTKLMEFQEFKEMCMNSAREFGRHAPKEPITCPVKDEFLPMHLLGEAKSGTRSNCVEGESRVPVATNDLSMDPFAIENQSDTKEEYPRDPLGDSDDCGEEDLAETACNEEAVFFNESKQLLMDYQGEVKNEAELTEMVSNVESHRREIIDEGDFSDTGGPILLSDILAVMNMEDCCNIIEDVIAEPEKNFHNFGADRQGISQNQILNNPSCNSVHEDTLPLECSKPNSVAVDSFPERMVRKQKKNVKVYAPSNKSSQISDRAMPVRNHEREQFCHQAENNSYPTEYVCNYCNARYSEKSPLALHIKRHVDGTSSASILRRKEFPPTLPQSQLAKAFKCNECGKMFSKKHGICRHLVVHSGVKAFKCNECGKMFSRSASLGIHSRIHSGVKSFKCNECGKMFNRSDSLRIHARIHSGLKPFKCDECGKMFSRSDSLRSHSRIHSGMMPFKCNECGKMFSTSSLLKTHLVIHTGVKPFKCDECGKMFNLKGNLSKHSVLHTGVKPFKCDECGKMFSTRSLLKTHSVLHTRVKPFKCDECGKLFHLKVSLSKHSVIHTGVKQFKCDQCGKIFTTKRDLKGHLSIHSGLKPFKCNECGKVFTRSRTLGQHSVLHTGVKPFKCDECGKMFTWSSSLSRHSYVHTGVTPFKCNECGKMFKLKDNLRKHIVLHTGVKPFKCDECGKMFTRKSDLKTHSVVHTGVEGI